MDGSGRSDRRGLVLVAPEPIPEVPLWRCPGFANTVRGNPNVDHNSHNWRLPIPYNHPEPPAHPPRPEKRPTVEPPAERPVPASDEPTPESADNEI